MMKWRRAVRRETKSRGSLHTNSKKDVRVVKGIDICVFGLGPV
jgi:hypothetical protein